MQQKDIDWLVTVQIRLAYLKIYRKNRTLARGMELSPSTWLKEQYEYSMPIALLGGILDISDEDQPTDEELMELAMVIPISAQSVYNIAFDAREDERSLNDIKKKLGRNHACLCGSGKKYKKCCLGREKVETIH